MNHNLKTWPKHFQAIKRGEKTFEVRKMDRPYTAGDHLVLQEWNPETESYTQDVIWAEVMHILTGGQFGIEAGFCVMSIYPKSGMPPEVLRDKARDALMTAACIGGNEACACEAIRRFSYMLTAEGQAKVVNAMVPP